MSSSRCALRPGFFLAAAVVVAACSAPDDLSQNTPGGAGSAGAAGKSGASGRAGNAAAGSAGATNTGGSKAGGGPGTSAAGTSAAGMGGAGASAGSVAAGAGGGTAGQGQAGGSGVAGQTQGGASGSAGQAQGGAGAAGANGGAAGAVAGAGGSNAGAGGTSVELLSIPSNFDRSAWIQQADVPPSADPDVVGAFRFICNASHLGYNDPIVYPGQPGKSHLHQFFGNTLADASSTYDSLRTTGESTCGDVLNRSAYWIPAMMNGKGKVVRPDYVSIYYKRLPKTSPDCAKQGKECVPLPRGLRYVFGFNMATPQVLTSGYFNCDGPTATPGHYPSITEAAKNCPNGNRLGAVISAPDCWNGTQLDSPDHRSHMAEASYGDWGYLKCPDTHPYVIPTFTLGAWYTTDDDLDRSGTWTPGKSTWSLSSDTMPNMVHEPGTTLHADWWGAWDDETMKVWTDNCIDKKLNCSDGILGDGTQMKRFPGFSYEASPRVVDPPPKP